MIDLHIHTTATPHHSSWAPDDLAATASARGLTVIAAADHNTTASVRALQVAGARHGLRVISGVEIDSCYGGKLWHTLVYGADPQAPELLALCDAVFSRNAEDARRLMADLPRRGFRLGGLEALGRTPNVADVATALAAQNELPGRVGGEGDEEAGMRYLLTELPGAYSPPGVDEVIAVAHHLGSLAVLAHPGRSKGIYAVPADAGDIAALATAGLDGVEVYYPSHSPEMRAFLLGQARLHGLLVSGGNDSHHPHQSLAAIPPDLVRGLLDRLPA
ncbi:PHP domain-containing protein [Oscillochloris sp. ZM17-4]|uniref:PHP domain-containing protein n=1 Tax=Oscillochloris sp. ZM17-4 TaxID=2866714 RepID=UPI001C73184A|nr:PHP domain-containing protein [Oscillochloris sp. ZM17-4]MBX0327351.1 PHP domain-containing protein [Oscillochloris sp. ZM17-4]